MTKGRALPRRSFFLVLICRPERAYGAVIAEYLPAPASIAAKYVRRAGSASVVTTQLRYVGLYRAVPVDQQDDLLVLCRLMLDIQAVQEKFNWERWRLSKWRE